MSVRKSDDTPDESNFLSTSIASSCRPQRARTMAEENCASAANSLWGWFFVNALKKSRALGRSPWDNLCCPSQNQACGAKGLLGYSLTKAAKPAVASLSRPLLAWVHASSSMAAWFNSPLGYVLDTFS